MYFEDEKDFIDENSNLHVAEDGTVSWEDILSEEDNGTVEFLDDDQVVDDVQSSDNYVLPEEQPEFIQSGSNEEVQYIDSNQDFEENPIDEVQTVAQSASDSMSEDFDIDKQMNDISLEESEGVQDDFAMPNKEKKKSSSTPVLLALLVALIVMGGWLLQSFRIRCN